MALVAEDDFGSDQEFRWTEDDNGFEYSPSVGSSSCKSNARVAPYLSCFQVSVMSSSPSPASVGFFHQSASRSFSSAGSSLPHSISTALQSLLQRLSHSSIFPDSSCRLADADSGATDHMFPDKSVISYKATSGLKVQMGNNSYLPVLGPGSSIISLNGQRVLVRHARHVPGLAMPLYSLRAHFKQPGCGFIGNNDAGMLVYFPSFVLSADTSSDCTLSYEPLGRSAPLSTLHYIQPRCRPSLYPSEISPSSQTVSRTPELIEDDPVVVDSDPPVDQSVQLPSPPSFHLSHIASQLQSIVASVLPKEKRQLQKTPVLLSTMSSEEVTRLLHHPNTSLPDIPPCDIANASDTKTHWLLEEIHRIMGCWKF